jgi:uncharacterized protein YbbK (DUF523 family)
VSRAERLSKRIVDRRSRTVVFVSHCLLNPNTRYLGGAPDPSRARALVRGIEETGAGIVQMPCPEQRAWGGMAKRLFLRAYGCRGTLLYAARGIVVPLFLLSTRMRYALLARQQAKLAADCVRAGCRVTGIVAVDGSPSCGLSVSLDVPKAFRLHAEGRLEEMDASWADRTVLDCCIPGQGLFTAALQRQLARRGLEAPWSAYDLPAEIRGVPRSSRPGGRTR